MSHMKSNVICTSTLTSFLLNEHWTICDNLDHICQINIFYDIFYEITYVSLLSLIWLNVSTNVKKIEVSSAYTKKLTCLGLLTLSIHHILSSSFSILYVSKLTFLFTL